MHIGGPYFGFGLMLLQLGAMYYYASSVGGIAWLYLLVVLLVYLYLLTAGWIQ